MVRQLAEIGHLVYQEATARLRALAATSQPAPELPAPPPPKPRSLRDVVKEFEGLTDAASEAADEEE